MSSLKWSYNCPKGGYKQSDWNETIITKINQLSAKIHKKYAHGGANLLYCSSNLRNIIENLSYYEDGQFGGRYVVKFVESHKNTIEIVGKIGESNTIMVTDYNPLICADVGEAKFSEYKSDNSIAIGCSNSDSIVSGCNNIITGSNPTFNPKVSIDSRYALKPINEDFYDTVRVDGIKTNRRRLLLR